MQYSNLLVGKGKNFQNFLIGKKRLKDYDKDGVPDIFDCSPRNKYKDSTLTPEQTEYNKQLEKYNQEMQAYQNYIQEKQDYEQAKKLYFKRQQGIKIPLDPSSKVDRMIIEWERKREIAQFLEMKKPTSPEIPVGYQGVSTAEGIKLEKIPEKTTYPTKEIKEVIKPKETPLTPYLQPKYKLPEYQKKELPYQRTTVTTIPQPALVEVKGKPQSLLLFSQKVITTPADYLRGLPEKEIYPENYLYTYQPKIETPRKETISYVEPQLPKFKQLEKEYISKENLEQFKVKEKLKYLTEEEQKELIKVYEEESKKRQEKFEKEYTKLESKEKFVRRRVGDVISLGLYSIPYYGATLFASDIKPLVYDVNVYGAKTLLGIPSKEPEMITFAKKYPVQFATETAGSLAIFGLGGKAVKTYKTSQIKEKLKYTEIQTKFKGKIEEAKLGKYDLTKSEKTKISKELKQGKQAREVEYTLKAFSEDMPKIEAKGIELIDSKGNIANRFLFGEITAEYKGKKIKEPIKAKSIIEIQEEGIVGYTELAQLKKNKISKFYEESKIESVTQKKRKSLTKSEQTASLIGTEKFRGEKKMMKEYGLFENENIIFQKLPDYKLLKKQSKPIVKGKTAELQEGIGQIGAKIGKAEKGVVADYRLYETRGKGYSKRILEEPKIKKESKPFQLEILEKEKIKLKKSKPKIEKSQITEQKQITRQTQIPMTSGAFLYEMDFSRLVSSPLRLGNLNYERLQPQVKINTITQTRVSNLLKPISIEKEKSKQKESQISFTAIIPKETTKEKQSSVLRQPQLQRELQKEELKQRYSTPRMTNIPINPIPIYPEEFKFSLKIPEEKESLKKEQGYDSYAYIQATKPRKSYWKKLNKEPLVEQSALSLSARYVDNTISARGKIVKSKSKKEPKDFNDDYYENNLYKFRQFKQKKGKKIKTPKQFIEKQKFRLDKSGEVKKIQEEKVSSFFGF